MRENEWNMINNILLEVYSLDDIKDIAFSFLNLIRALITYSQAHFIILDENKKIDCEKSSFYNVTEENKNKYINYYYNIDYINYIFNFTRSITFKDSEIMADELRKKTEFYQNFLLPQNIPYGGGIVFVKENRILGMLTLFRSKELGDITQRELNILDIIKDHLSNILYSVNFSTKTNDGRENLKVDDLSRYRLSKRESEIVKLLIDGCTNSEISETLCISLSTVKKHVYNIFTKFGVNSRIQLIKIMQKSN